MCRNHTALGLFCPPLRCQRGKRCLLGRGFCFKGSGEGAVSEWAILGPGSFLGLAVGCVVWGFGLLTSIPTPF